MIDKETLEKLGQCIEKLSNLLGGEALPLGLPQKHSMLVGNLKDLYKQMRQVYVDAGGEDHWAVYDNHLGVQ